MPSVITISILFAVLCNNEYNVTFTMQIVFIYSLKMLMDHDCTFYQVLYVLLLERMIYLICVQCDLTNACLEQNYSSVIYAMGMSVLYLFLVTALVQFVKHNSIAATLILVYQVVTFLSLNISNKNPHQGITVFIGIIVFIDSSIFCCYVCFDCSLPFKSFFVLS